MAEWENFDETLHGYFCLFIFYSFSDHSIASSYHSSFADRPETIINVFGPSHDSNSISKSKVVKINTLSETLEEISSQGKFVHPVSILF